MANTSNRGDQTGQAREHTEAAKSHLQQAGGEAKQAATSAASGLAQKAQDTAAAMSPELEPDGVRDQGGDHTTRARGQRVHAAGAD